MGRVLKNDKPLKGSELYMIEHLPVDKFIYFKKITAFVIMSLFFLLINMFVLQWFLKQLVQ